MQELKIVHTRKNAPYAKMYLKEEAAALLKHLPWVNILFRLHLLVELPELMEYVLYPPSHIYDRFMSEG